MREKVTTLNSKKKRSSSSRAWLLRQLNDPYVEGAHQEGYRSRAAFKLREIDQKYKIFKPSQNIVDLGCAPGGWLQVAQQRAKGGRLVGLDLQEIAPLEGVAFVQGDFTETQAVARLLEALEGRFAQVLLSDMAAPSCGISKIDYVRIMSLISHVWELCPQILAPEGHLIAKVLRGGTEAELLAPIKKHFRKISHFKPHASRADSAEMYLVARRYKP
ncbi:ribosomal RNA large subunit methyltransferase E [Alphaproteobacteria bacterium]|nr:ribosomal RNA large subunit methyltransferase E [Alphaproteobacteria bacterium]GHS99013.1 ribosomal RNA large subunit methyltransferase E [Alphaproteobacteria bacterium]